MGVVRAELKEKQFTSQQTDRGEPTGYGIGWYVSTDSLGHRWVFHGGSSVGGSTAFGVDRDSRIVLAITSNLAVAPLLPGPAIQAVFDRELLAFFHCRVSNSASASGLTVLISFFFQAEDGIRDIGVTGVQTCALPI